jgi:hypothetical protein
VISHRLKNAQKNVATTTTKTAVPASGNCEIPQFLGGRQVFQLSGMLMTIPQKNSDLLSPVTLSLYSST